MKIVKNKYASTFSTPTLYHYKSLDRWCFNNPTIKKEGYNWIMEYTLI